MADISTIKPVERQFDVKHPASDHPYVRVTLVSIDDEGLKKTRRAIQDERIRLNNRGKSFNAEQLEENQLKLQLAAIKDWQWLTDENGEQVTFQGSVPDFNRKNVKDVLSTVDWFAEQVAEHMGETKDFFDTSKPS